MAFSQKHPGLVMVPWYNMAEWKSVYNYIYSDEKNLPKALEILLMWKTRQPLLFAGVEGTLIVLQALLVSPTKLNDYEMRHIFSTSVIRFLNLCAANAEKQGTFYKLAKENGLPQWLIDLRHQIAHSHTVPSRSALEMSLNFCLDWLKEKYWEDQEPLLKDFYVGDIEDSVVEDAVNVLIHFNSEKEADEEINRTVAKLIKLRKIKSTKKICEDVTQKLKDAIKFNRGKAIKTISKILLTNSRLLSMECKIHNNGSKKIVKKELNDWSKLLNIFLEAEILLDFFSNVLIYIVNEANDFQCREVGSLILRHIFRGLIRQEETGKAYLNFSKSKSIKSKGFCSEVITNVTPLTLNFVKEVLTYNNAPAAYIDDCITIISASLTITTEKETSNKIFTVEDLNLDMDFLLKDEDVPTPKVTSTSRWQIVEDISIYQNLPLGVLPHQSRETNPCIAL